MRTALQKKLKRPESVEELAEEWNNSVAQDQGSEYFGKKAEPKHEGLNSWVEIDGLSVGLVTSAEMAKDQDDES